MLKKNVYHEVLGWGDERIDAGVTFEEFRDFLNIKSGNSLSEKRAKALFRELFIPIQGNSTESSITQSIEDGARFHLKVESTFRHIELQELNEARRSSQSAMHIAILAIVIGALVGCVQIYIALAGS